HVSVGEAGSDETGGGDHRRRLTHHRRDGGGIADRHDALAADRDGGGGGHRRIAGPHRAERHEVGEFGPTGTSREEHRPEGQMETIHRRTSFLRASSRSSALLPWSLAAGATAKR